MLSIIEEDSDHAPSDQDADAFHCQSDHDKPRHHTSCLAEFKSNQPQTREILKNQLETSDYFDKNTIASENNNTQGVGMNDAANQINANEYTNFPGVGRAADNQACSGRAINIQEQPTRTPHDLNYSECSSDPHEDSNRSSRSLSSKQSSEVSSISEECPTPHDGDDSTSQEECPTPHDGDESISHEECPTLHDGDHSISQGILNGSVSNDFKFKEDENIIESTDDDDCNFSSHNELNSHPMCSEQVKSVCGKDIRCVPCGNKSETGVHRRFSKAPRTMPYRKPVKAVPNNLNQTFNVENELKKLGKY